MTENTWDDHARAPWYLKGLIITFIVIAFVLNAGCGQTKGSTTSGSKESDKQETETKQHFTNDNFSNVLSNANKYKGATVDITGKIFLPPKKDGDMWQFQIYTDPKQNEGNTIVVASTTFEINDGDFVRVRGAIDKKIDYETLMGAKMSAPLIIAGSIEEVAAQDVMAPTENVIEVNQAQDQHGIVITLKKVEFAESETRLYIHVKNNTDKSASVHTFQMKITQGSKQYDEENSFDSGYPELQSDLLPGVESEGVVVFPKLDYGANQFTFFAEASSDNYYLDFNPYQFLVQWQQ